MIAMVFVGWLVSVNVLLYLWYRRARRKRYAERLQRAVCDAARRELHERSYDLSPRDVAELRELVEEAHRR